MRLPVSIAPPNRYAVRLTRAFVAAAALAASLFHCVPLAFAENGASVAAEAGTKPAGWYVVVPV